MQPPLSQRAIYDARYRAGGYDRRSAVRVLTAEAQALRQAARRVLDRICDLPEVSLLDFGYGTGRVTNQFIDHYVHTCGRTGRNLRVIAYDVSSVGLRRAAGALQRSGFAASTELAWRPDSSEGYVAGVVEAARNGMSVSVVFVHASELEPAQAMRRLVAQANDGRPSTITTSWYSGLGHVAGAGNRDQVLAELDKVTDPRGELLIAVSATGDLVEEQPVWERRRADGDTSGFPVSEPGDVMYQTELGQLNYWHLFGTDLEEHMARICHEGQRVWIEGLRLPDDEFTSKQEELENYDRVTRYNHAKRGHPWTPDDYRAFHSVLAVRSGPATWPPSEASRPPEPVS